LNARAALFQHEIVRRNGETFLARLVQHGFLASLEKALDGLEKFRGRDFGHALT
jgi:hypothetical protein